jgi:hypothetical protein
MNSAILFMRRRIADGCGGGGVNGGAGGGDRDGGAGSAGSVSNPSETGAGTSDAVLLNVSPQGAWPLSSVAQECSRKLDPQRPGAENQVRRVACTAPAA